MAQDATQILADQAAMESKRSNFDQLWNSVAQLLLPRQADFLDLGLDSAEFNQGRRRTERIFDETAMLALDHGCAVFESEVIPQGGQWQRLQTRDPALMKKRDVALFMEALTGRLFSLRNSPYSGWANQTHESVASLLSFGFQGMWTDRLMDPTGRPIGLAYHSEHIGQLYVRNDERGAVELNHRKFSLTHRQALAKWGDEAPECVQKAARDHNSSALDKSAEYIQRIEPNADYDPGRIDWRGKPFASCYVSIADKQTFAIGGYRTRPLTCSRYEKSPMEDYGRSPGINVLPAILGSQQITADLVTAIEFMAKPALGAHDDMLDQLLMYSPGGVTYGAFDDRGNQLVKQLFDNPDISAAVMHLQDVRKVIQRAFFEDLYLVRQEVKTHVSATEQMLRDQQKGILLSPLKRQENEWFTPQTERELDLMADMGMLDDMPRVLAEAGGMYQIVYENPLNRAREAGEAAGYYQLLQGLAPAMQLDPENTVKQFFRVLPFDRTLAGLANVHGVPESWRASEEEQQAADDDARALADKASLLETGAAAAGIAKDLAAAAPPAPAAGTRGMM